MFVTNWISTTKIQKISEITNFFRHYFLSRTEVTFIQTTMLMPTCSRQTLVKGHAFLVKPAYYLKSLYGVREFCVYDVSVMPKEYVQ